MYPTNGIVPLSVWSSPHVAPLPRSRSFEVLVPSGSNSSQTQYHVTQFGQSIDRIREINNSVTIKIVNGCHIMERN